MTDTPPGGTPLILSVLALVISSLSAAGSIAAVLMARANLQRQIRVATREAWMLEFREQVAQFLTGIMNSRAGGAMAEMGSVAEIVRSVTSSATVISLLIAERGPRYTGFFEQNVNRLLVLARRSDATTEGMFEIADAVSEATNAAADILRRERALVEADALRKIPGLGAIQWHPWSWFAAWCRRDPPRFPDLP